MLQVPRMFRFIILLGVAIALCLACWFAWDMYTTVILSPRIQQELGFELAYIHDATVPGRRVKRIDYVAPEEIFAKAGFVEGDIIVDDLWLGQFYRLLHRSRGTAVTIHVVSGGDGPPLGDREVRALTFTVPSGAVRSTREDGDQLVGDDLVLQSAGHAGPRVAGCAAAHGVHDDEDSAFRSGERSVYFFQSNGSDSSKRVIARGLTSNSRVCSTGPRLNVIVCFPGLNTSFWSSPSMGVNST